MTEQGNGTTTSGPSEMRAVLTDPGAPLGAGEITALARPREEEFWRELRKEIRDGVISGVLAFHETTRGKVAPVAPTTGNPTPPAPAPVKEMTLEEDAVALVQASGATGVPQGELLRTLMLRHDIFPGGKVSARLAKLQAAGTIHKRNTNEESGHASENRFSFFYGPDPRPRYRGGKGRVIPRHVAHATPKVGKTSGTTPRVKMEKAERVLPGDTMSLFPGGKRPTPSVSATQGVPEPARAPAAEPTHATRAPARTKHGGQPHGAGTESPVRPETVGPAGRVTVPFAQEEVADLMRYARSTARRTGRAISLAFAARSLALAELGRWKARQDKGKRPGRKGT